MYHLQKNHDLASDSVPPEVSLRCCMKPEFFKPHLINYQENIKNFLDIYIDVFGKSKNHDLACDSAPLKVSLHET